MIEISNVSLILDNRKILKDINLSLEKGRIYGIIGPNGVGKTTLLRCLNGAYKPTKGKVLYDGEEVFNNPLVKARIGFVADENNYFSNFKVKDILKYYKLTYSKFNEEKFLKINKSFNIDLNKRVFQLSKGMKMRVALMSAIAQEPEYLILDEPTSGLDPLLKKKLIKILLREVADNKTTILISSHHLSELEKICDDVIILDGGEVSYNNTLWDMKKKIRKFQVAFDAPIYEEDIEIEGVFKLSRIGRVFTIITEDYSEKFLESINKYNPLFIEEIDLSLEDIFVYKLGGELEDETV